MYDLVAFGEILIDLSFDKEENRYLQNPYLKECVWYV